MPATNIYNSISEAWEADATLNALCPASRIWTERVENEDLPYVTIKILDEKQDGKSSKRATFWIDIIEVCVRAESYTVARAIQQEYRRVLEAAAFEPTLDDGIFQEWTRLNAGKTIEDGKVGKAFDRFQLRKQVNT